MLTGDAKRVAQQVAGSLGVDEVYSDLLPADKATKIEELLRMKSEKADIVLMDDEPMQIAKAIKISRKCIGIVYQNIVFALIIKFACLALGAVGIANMWFAIFADVGVIMRSGRLE